MAADLLPVNTMCQRRCGPCSIPLFTNYSTGSAVARRFFNVTQTFLLVIFSIAVPECRWYSET